MENDDMLQDKNLAPENLNQPQSEPNVTPSQTPAEKAPEEKPMDEYERLSRLYNTRVEKKRPMAIVLMVLAIMASVVTLAVGGYYTVVLCLSVAGVDGGQFFGANANNLSFGIAGLTGFIFYVSAFALIILIVGLTVWAISMYLKLFKNLRQTSHQPYHVSAYNGTIIYSIIAFAIFEVLLLFGCVTIWTNVKPADFASIAFLIITILTGLILVALLVEFVVSRIKFAKYPDAELKSEIKKEAHARFKYFLLKKGRDDRRAKNRRIWF